MGAADQKPREAIEIADAATVRLLPYHFAKAKGIITARQVSGEIEVWLAPEPASSTLSEVRRMTGKTLDRMLDLVQEIESSIMRALPMVEVLAHIEPLEDPRSWDDPKQPLAGS